VSLLLFGQKQAWDEMCVLLVARMHAQSLSLSLCFFLCSPVNVVLLLSVVLPVLLSLCCYPCPLVSPAPSLVPSSGSLFSPAAVAVVPPCPSLSLLRSSVCCAVVSRVVSSCCVWLLCLCGCSLLFLPASLLACVKTEGEEWRGEEMGAEGSNKSKGDD